MFQNFKIFHNYNTIEIGRNSLFFVQRLLWSCLYFMRREMITFYMSVWLKSLFMEFFYLYIDKMRLKILPLRLKLLINLILCSLMVFSCWNCIIANERIYFHYNFIVPNLDIFKIAHKLHNLYPSIKWVYLAFLVFHN